MNIRAKLLVYVMITSMVILTAVVVFLQYRAYTLEMRNAMRIAKGTGESISNSIKAELELDLGFSRSLANGLNSYYIYDKPTLDSVFQNLAKQLVVSNPRYIAVWYNLEYYAIRPNYDKTYGRESISAFLKNGAPQILIEQKNVTGDVTTSGYYSAKSTNREVLLNPYFYSFDGGANEFLVTSMCVPVTRDGAFMGLAGVDLTLDKFQKTIEDIKPYPKTQSFLLSNNGTIISHTNTLLAGTAFQINFPEIEMKHNLSKKVSQGIGFDFEWSDGKDNFLYIITPIKVGNSLLDWSLGICIPIREITREARISVYYSILAVFIGLVLLSIVLFYVAKSITSPILKTIHVLNEMAEGDIDMSKKLSIQTGDEIEEMANSVNKLIDGLNLTENFAKEIGRGNLDAEFRLLSDKDILGISLIEMQKSLRHAKAFEQERKVEEQKLNWATQGMAKFGDILRQNNDNLNELSFNTLQNLIDYTGSNQGGVFVINDNDRDHPFLEMTACYAYDRRKFLERQIEIGEGLVGRCYHERKTIFMVDVPENYINISSGLGKERPRCLLIVPLKNNEEILGVIEMATFKVYEKYQIEFIEKLAESIAATISSVRINIRTTELLSKSQQQAEEMLAQDEEMRQNMEELQATQEEMERKHHEREQIQQELQKELTLLNALMDNIPDYIYFKDDSSRFIRVSRSMVQLFNASSPDELVGRSDYDFHTQENAQKFYDEEQEIMRSMMPIVDHEVYEKLDDGREQWVSTTKMPLIDLNGEIVGTWGISKIITDRKQAQLKAQDCVKEAERLKGSKSSHEGEYKAIVKAIDATTFVAEYTPFGDIIRINEPLQSIMGKLSAEVKGKHHAEFFRTKADDDASYQDFWDDLQKGIIRQRVFKGSIGGSRLTLNETYSPVLDSNGIVEKIIAIAVRG